MCPGQLHGTDAACSRQTDKAVLLCPHAGYDTVAGLKALVPVVNTVTVGMVSDEKLLILPEEASSALPGQSSGLWVMVPE